MNIVYPSSHLPKQIVIEEPLWGFMLHCQVYCSGDCCGSEAFEVHKALILRKVIDMNRAKLDGSAVFRLARQQIAELRQRVSAETLQVVDDEVPFWTLERFMFCLPKDEVVGWLEKWETGFEEASHYGGLSKNAA